MEISKLAWATEYETLLTKKGREKWGGGTGSGEESGQEKIKCLNLYISNAFS